MPNTGLGGHLFFSGVPCGQITSSFCLGDDGVSRVSKEREGNEMMLMERLIENYLDVEMIIPDNLV